VEFLCGDDFRTSYKFSVRCPSIGSALGISEKSPESLCIAIKNTLKNVRNKETEFMVLFVGRHGLQ
jgi:hypothetical protein